MQDKKDWKHAYGLWEKSLNLGAGHTGAYHKNFHRKARAQKYDVKIKHNANSVIFGKQVLTIKASKLTALLLLPPPQNYLSQFAAEIQQVSAREEVTGCLKLVST